MNEEQKAILRKGVEWVEEQARYDDEDPQREWYQGAWHLTQTERQRYFGQGGEETVECGSAYCLFGYIAVNIMGQQFQRDGEHLTNGEDVADYVRELLGLSVPDAIDLWDPNNSAEDIRTLAERTAGERL